VQVQAKEGSFWFWVAQMQFSVDELTDWWKLSEVVSRAIEEARTYRIHGIIRFEFESSNEPGRSITLTGPWSKGVAERFIARVRELEAAIF